MAKPKNPILPKTVALIGSFKQNYDAILDDWHVFNDSGLLVRSPKGTSIIEPGEFVRFQSDDPKLTDPQIEQVALHRILGADFVYARLLGQTIGKTACMEVGWIMACNRPLYFSAQPEDLPLEVPAQNIATPAELVERFRTEMPRPLLESLAGPSFGLALGLANHRFRDI